MNPSNTIFSYVESDNLTIRTEMLTRTFKAPNGSHSC
jgi:hypothetical protein